MNEIRKEFTFNTYGKYSRIIEVIIKTGVITKIEKRTNINNTVTSNIYYGDGLYEIVGNDFIASVGNNLKVLYFKYLDKNFLIKITDTKTKYSFGTYFDNPSNVITSMLDLKKPNTKTTIALAVLALLFLGLQEKNIFIYATLAILIYFFLLNLSKNWKQKNKFITDENKKNIVTTFYDILEEFDQIA